MSYIEKKVLLPTDKEVYQVKKNAIFLVLRWIWGILGCWLIFIPTIAAIRETIEFNTTEFFLTSNRIIEKRGWLNTSCDEIRMDKIENVTLNQSIWGKIFNFGDVVIQGANRNNVYFTAIKNPEEVRRKINQFRNA